MNSRILPIIALLVAAGIFFMYVNPTWSGTIAATKQTIALDDQALAAASQYAAQQDTLASARNAIDPADLARLETFLPDSVDNVGLILDLNALAARSGLSLSNIDVIAGDGARAAASMQQGLPAAGASPVGSVDLSLSAVGTYAALQSFLVGVERSARFLHVMDIVVKGSDTGVYNYQMSLRLFWLR
ncbi:MAG: GspMb/PilO family protein [Minisyncoccia bacterium]